MLIMKTYGKYLIEFKYHDNGNIRIMSYTMNNKHHNENGPAIIYYDINGNIMQEWFKINGKNPSNEPSLKNYNKTGSLNDICYSNDNYLHRTNGPAYIKYKNNVPYKEDYYLNGKNINNLIKEYPTLLKDKSLMKILL